MLPSPNHNYINVDFVTSGHLGIVDARTKTAVALFRTTGTSTGRQNHMSLRRHWNCGWTVVNDTDQPWSTLDLSFEAYDFAREAFVPSPPALPYRSAAHHCLWPLGVKSSSSASMMFKPEAQAGTGMWTLHARRRL